MCAPFGVGAQLIDMQAVNKPPRPGANDRSRGNVLLGKEAVADFSAHPPKAHRRVRISNGRVLFAVGGEVGGVTRKLPLNL